MVGHHLIISDLLRDNLHWLRVPQRIVYKLCLITYKVLNDRRIFYSSCLSSVGDASDQTLTRLLHCRFLFVFGSLYLSLCHFPGLIPPSLPRILHFLTYYIFVRISELINEAR